MLSNKYIVIKCFCAIHQIFFQFNPVIRFKPAKKSSPNSKKSYRQKKSIAKQRRQNGTLGRLK